MREFRKPIKVLLFLSSYTPLFFIMGLKFWSVGPMIVAGKNIKLLNITLSISYLTVSIFALCTILTLILYYVIGVHATRGTTQRPVDEYKKRNELLSTYLLVYVFVFAGLNFTNPLDFTIFLVFFSILGVLQIQSGHLHVNPMLGIRGYEIYEITSNAQVMLVISDGSIEEKVMSPQSEDTTNTRNKVEVVALDTTTYLAP